LIGALADTLPTYRLPPGALGHTRHYMPLGVVEHGREKTTLVFDSWLDVGAQPLVVRWPCDLDSEALDLFGVLAHHLGYLGRSESWVVAESVAGDSMPLNAPDAFPHADVQCGERGWEQVPLMAAERPTSYADWRAQSVAAACAAFPLPVGRKPGAALLRKRAAAEAPFPTDVVECLQKDTAWWKAHCWSQPPGSRRVLYWRRSDALNVAPVPRPSRRIPARIEMMLLAITTAHLRPSALPRASRTLPQGELIHRALVARIGHGEHVDCPELTGRGRDGKPLSGHQHAHVLPVDLDGDGGLDHVVIFATMGLGPAAQHAIRTLNRTWTKGGVGELRLALAGQGSLDNLRYLRGASGDGVTDLLGQVGGSSRWISATPFVPPRHLKRRGTNTIEGQVNAELASRGLPPAVAEILPWHADNTAMRHAVRVRRAPAAPPPVDIGFSLRLAFEAPVSGPVVLGYGSHFGLGRFEAIRSD